MKFYIIGLGSMGKKRVRNLQALGYNDIFGYDIREDRMDECRKKYGVKVFETFEKGAAENPDVLIISTWPVEHEQYMEYAIDNNIPFFSEMTWPKDIKNYRELISRLKRKKKLVGLPSCTMRFHPSVIKLKQLLDKGRIKDPLFIRYHSGQYLRDWHPFEDIKDYYVRDKDLGGGREQVMFEIDWLRWILGDVKKVWGVAKKLTKMEIKTYDYYNFFFEFKNGVNVDCTVDLIQRDHNRNIKVISESGQLEWNWKERGVQYYDAKKQTYKVYPESGGYAGYFIEEMYKAEIRAFLKSVKTGTEHYPHNFDEELKNILLVSAMETSWQTGKIQEFK